MNPILFSLAFATVGQMTPAEPLTAARIAQYSGADKAAWQAYFARSQALLAADKAALAAERADGSFPAAPLPGKQGEASMPLKRPAAWYGSPDARRVADNIVSFQTPAGGWGKNVDRNAPVREKGQLYVINESKKESWTFVGTIDNDATITELRFLAKVQEQVPAVRGEVYRQSFYKGVRYLLNAQYPNGGFPQVYPLEGGYHDAITFNDNAVVGVLDVLARVALQKDEFAFVPAELANAALVAHNKAIDMILASQIVQDGVRTAWCQQHDMLSLAPVGARNFEPAAITSGESAGLLMLLMRQPNPTPAMAAAIDAGIAWLRKVAVRDAVWGPTADGRKLQASAGAGPIWSRLYDIRTNRPVFGDRDRSIHDDVNDLIAERRNGYGWFGDWGSRAIEQYEKWKKGRGRIPKV